MDWIDQGSLRQTETHRHPVSGPSGTRYFASSEVASHINAGLLRRAAMLKYDRGRKPARGSRPDELLMAVRDSSDPWESVELITPWGHWGQMRLSPQEIMYDIKQGYQALTKDGKPRQRRYRGGAKRGPKPKGVSGGSI